jgi:hypothetical protein
MTRNEPTKTIGHARAAGETRFTIHCEATGCHHQAEMTFDELGLPDETIFVHIPRVKRFTCSKCKRRNVKVMPIFPLAKGMPGWREPSEDEGKRG